IVLTPGGRRDPLMVTLAVATPPEADRFAYPRSVFPELKNTVPAGVEPPCAFTVAVKAAEPFGTSRMGFAVSVTVVATELWVDGAPAQLRTKLYPSSEPSPVAGSYPGPAL